MQGRKSKLKTLRCEECEEKTAITKWGCCCGRPLLKCGLHCHKDEKPLHVFELKEKKGKPKAKLKRKQLVNMHGEDKPLPKKRKLKHEDEEERFCATTGTGIIRLRPGTKLAAKFPWLVFMPNEF